MGRKANAVLRIGTEGGRLVSRTLKGIGATGKRAMDKLAAATRKPSRAMRALNGSMKRLNDSMRTALRSVPVVGGALAALGPAGLVAAAGVAVLTLGLAKAAREGRKAAEGLDLIAKAARASDLTTDTYQALQFGAITEGVQFQAMEGALRALRTRTAEARTGTGELITKLGELDPAFVRNVVAAETMEDRLRIVAVRLSEATTQSERNLIATSAFGRAGERVQRILAGYGGSIEDMTAAAREAGTVLDEELFRHAERVTTQFGIASRTIDLQFKEALLPLAPLALATAEAIADITTSLSEFTEQFDRLGRLDESGLERQLEMLQRLRDVELQRAQSARFGFQRDNAQGFVDRFSRQIEEVEARLDALRHSENETLLGGGTADEEALRLLNEGLEVLGRNAALETLRNRAIALTASMRTVDEVFAATVDELQELERQGLLTGETVARGIAAAREELEKSNEVLQKAREVTAALVTEEQRLAAEINLVTQAVRDGYLTQQQADDYIKQRTDSLNEQSDAVERLKVEELLLEEILLGQIESWEDLGQVAVRVLKRIVLEAIRANSGIEQGLGAFLGQEFGSVFGGAGGASAGAAASAGSGGAGVPSGPPIFHKGTPRVSFAGGKRQGLAMLEAGERVLSVTDNRSLIAAVQAAARPVVVVAGGGGGGFDRVVINNYGEPVESTQQTTGPDGRKQLEATVLKIVDGGIASGRFDRSNRNRYGHKPAVHRR